MPVLVLLSVAGLGMQQCMFWNRNEMYKLSKVKNGCKYAAYNKQFYATFPWQDFFPDTSLIFSKIPDISLTAVKFPDISRFSRQVVSLQILTLIPACNWQQRVAVTAKQITYRPTQSFSEMPYIHVLQAEINATRYSDITARNLRRLEPEDCKKCVSC